ncbi:MAG: DUF883 domain-containing protein [Phycisphaerae bacterium]|nr:DUF883 domain-containing protein [Phycisphaerae bacterium]
MTKADPVVDLETLKADLTALRDDVGSLSSQFLKQGSKTFRAARSAVEDKVTTATESVEAFVEERPLTTVIIAFGAGMLAATLLRRS